MARSHYPRTLMGFPAFSKAGGYGAASEAGEAPPAGGNTGWIFPTAALSNGAGVDWGTAINCIADDGVTTDAAFTTIETAKNLLVYDFDVSGIPDGATISQMEVRAEMLKSDASGEIDGFMKIMVGGSIVGAPSDLFIINVANTLYSFSESQTADPLWGLTPTVAQVKGSFFGFAVYNTNQNVDVAETVALDYCQMKIHWTV